MRWLVLLGLVACGSRPPPPAPVPAVTASALPPSSPPPDDQPPPPRAPEPTTEEAFGPAAMRVEITHRKGGIERVSIAGRAFYPPACTAGDASGLCSKRHRALAGDKGRDLRIVVHRDDPDRVDVLFHATTWGSSECATYGLWMLHVDAKGRRISEPIEDCFPVTLREEDVRWGRPTVVVVPSYLAGATIFTLDEKLTWKKILAAKAW